MRLSLLGAVAPLLASVAADHLDVTVGKDGKLQFQPEQLTAKVGDTITYRFFASNHSVAQSSFDKPCQPLDKGIFSGFVPTAFPDRAAYTTFTITVSDTKPIWVYNGQTNGNCQAGMLHAINPPPDSFAKFKAAAKTASTSPSPAGPPAGGVRKLRVEVGQNGLTFTPNQIREIPGTVLEFGFNARNHTVTQSSFSYPCQPLNKGFSSGFIATTKSPSGAVFQVTLNDTHPVWFYCGQPNGNHCQSGMVGSINADTEGKFTQEGFVQKAKEHAVASWIPHWAPIGGRVFVDGKEVRDFNLNGGNAIDVDALQGGPSPPPASGHPGGHPGGKPTGIRVTAAVPKPSAPAPSGGPSAPPTFDHKAGGGKPTNYGWADSISNEAVERLYTLSFIEQIIIKVLTSGYDKLARGGAWAGAYPISIVDILGTMGAQRVVHGATTEECLTHYGKPILRECTLKPAANLGQVTGFLHAVKSLNALGIGALIDTTTAVAATDPWLVPLVATEIGSKARLAAVINLMQNHTAAPMPREVLVPADLAWSYIMTHYVASCPDTIAGLPAKPYAPILEVSKEETAWRTDSVTVKYDATGHGGQHYVAWMGSYGLTGFTPIHGGKAEVPEAMYGNVWIAVVSNPNVPLGEIGKHIVAGPETVWIKNR